MALLGGAQQACSEFRHVCEARMGAQRWCDCLLLLLLNSQLSLLQARSLDLGDFDKSDSRHKRRMLVGQTNEDETSSVPHLNEHLPKTIKAAQNSFSRSDHTDLYTARRARDQAWSSRDNQDSLSIGSVDVWGPDDTSEDNFQAKDPADQMVLANFQTQITDQVSIHGSTLRGAGKEVSQASESALAATGELMEEAKQRWSSFAASIIRPKMTTKERLNEQRVELKRVKDEAQEVKDKAKKMVAFASQAQQEVETMRAIAKAETSQQLMDGERAWLKGIFEQQQLREETRLLQEDRDVIQRRTKEAEIKMNRRKESLAELQDKNHRLEAEVEHLRAERIELLKLKQSSEQAYSQAKKAQLAAQEMAASANEAREAAEAELIKANEAKLQVLEDKGCFV
ncbi:hypothetical protein CYMTET_21470 [Cymbomonas tetramitiformis]|uniref:Uncharacterized protein n=1 Tax=Cymbomonas tetramitiformis TaxID=36881 RepID=A0AAE0G234_9CHLO|nr:hypothetical protein CYMTET_21470 [Cymbomonas tetramitiformis]